MFISISRTGLMIGWSEEVQNRGTVHCGKSLHHREWIMTIELNHKPFCFCHYIVMPDAKNKQKWKELPQLLLVFVFRQI
jgi:hypothetical protein